MIASLCVIASSSPHSMEGMLPSRSSLKRVTAGWAPVLSEFFSRLWVWRWPFEAHGPQVSRALPRATHQDRLPTA